MTELLYSNCIHQSISSKQFGGNSYFNLCCKPVKSLFKFLGQKCMNRANYKPLLQDDQRWEKLGSLQMVSKFMSPGSLGSSLSKSLPKPMAPSARRASGLDTPSPSPHILSHKEILPVRQSLPSLGAHDHLLLCLRQHDLPRILKMENPLVTNYYMLYKQQSNGHKANC